MKFLPILALVMPAILFLIGLGLVYLAPQKDRHPTPASDYVPPLSNAALSIRKSRQA